MKPYVQILQDFLYFLMYKLESPKFKMATEFDTLIFIYLFIFF